MAIQDIKARSVQVDEIKSLLQDYIDTQTLLRYAVGVNPVDDFDLIPKWYLDNAIADFDLGFTPENVANKNQPNGYPGLDGSGKVAPAQLPSYVDDILEFANFSALPGTGETGKIYVTVNDNKEYRWSGSTYIQLVASPGTTDALAEGTTNLYYTNARVQTFGDTRYYPLSSNPANYLTSITSGMVTGALGYTPYNNSNPAGYITGINSSMVTSALGYTPYNSSNPAGYISSYTETDTLYSVTNRPAGAGTNQNLFIGSAKSDTWGAGALLQLNDVYGTPTLSGGIQLGATGIMIGNILASDGFWKTKMYFPANTTNIILPQTPTYINNGPCDFYQILVRDSNTGEIKQIDMTGYKMVDEGDGHYKKLSIINGVVTVTPIDDCV